MSKSFSHEHQLKAFINAAQYFTGLTSGQNIWEEAGKVLINFFGADIFAFGKYRADGDIELGHRAFSGRGASAQISGPEMIAAVRNVFESGFLTFLTFPSVDPIATAYFPILHDNRVIAVMLVGHLSSTSLEKETLDLYLAVAGLIGAAYSRELHRAHLEELVKERTSELTAANRELEGFSYSVSHDLRAPLRHIIGYTEMLQKRALSTMDETSLHYMTAISESAKKMGLLIDDLLAFSRMGRAEMKMRTLSLNAGLVEAIHEVRDEATGRNIIWKIDELPDVYGDEAMLRLVLINLISNAVKYTSGRSRTEIRIGCKEEGDEFIFFIEDNGAGFDMQYADKLFGVFQRLHTQEEFEGTGIGLANVRRIIARHGGRTWAEGSVGQGATFYFTLPKR